MTEAIIKNGWNGLPQTEDFQTASRKSSQFPCLSFRGRTISHEDWVCGQTFHSTGRTAIDLLNPETTKVG